ncbi:restriction endonuclease subunit S [Helicobacter pylori]|uniref:Type I restriction modification DNA specificity domain protein n=1 Tax=Helicobacter pylori R018c TaxID=1145110 RepID=K2JAK5_HELPX|nr:restriction endonuclease subunit S [Helicobacter pylori]EKE80366.1 type I restriction modification DNA specificity domain protein [Helicobacter pylori R018c]
MHKIERLLQTLAPNGVEFRKLGDIILSLKTGLNPRKFFKLNTPNANNYYVTVRELEEHTIKFTHQTDRIDDNALSLCLKRSNLEKDDILFSGTGTIGKVSIIKENPNNWAIKEGIYSIKPNKKIVFPRFLMFCFENLNIQNDIKSKSFGGIVKSISMNDLQQITIPIPPLEIQQEIVKILDAFTELNTELNTELKARKKQYEYYQNMLLDFNDINQSHKDAKMSAKPYPKRLKTLLQTLAPKGVEFRKLGEVCEILDNRRIPIAKNKRNPGIYPYYGANGIQDYIDNYIFDGDFVLVGEDGSVINKDNTPVVNWASGKIWVNNHAHVLQTKNELKLKFLYFYLQTIDVSYCVAGTPPKINQENLKKITIPIPPLEIQQEIVKILDQFSALTTDLLAGIPAEIKARKKQYEYYREKLLTFKPLTPHKEVKKG